MSSDVVTGAGLLVERRDGAVLITLDRPEALNSLDPAMLAGLQAVCAEVEADEAVRCVVLRGRGRSFCAGGDLPSSERARREGAPGPWYAAISAAMARIERLPVPTVAAVHGWVVAGGLELALCCDLVVATDTARFGDAHARYGLVPGGGGSVRLPRRIGVNRAKWLMYTAESVSAATMADWGLVGEVVGEHELDSAVERLVAVLRARSPLGLRRMKHLVDTGMTMSVPDALAQEVAVCTAHAGSADLAEGLAAFAAKREPRFTGR